MKTSKHLALTALGFFLTGCAGMSKTQSALVGAAACGAGGAGVGAAVAHHGINGSHVNEAIGAGIGLVTGALICGGLAYLIAQEPPPPPPPPPPPHHHHRRRRRSRHHHHPRHHRPLRQNRHRLSGRLFWTMFSLTSIRATSSLKPGPYWIGWLLS